jgi:hypothetical protein
MLEKKRISCKIIGTGDEIATSFKGGFVSFFLKRG